MSDASYVSTGHLPERAAVVGLVTDAFERYQGNRDGALSQVYPALAAARPDQFGVAVAAVDGQIIEVGDSRVRFALMSVAKPFTFALMCSELGLDRVRDLVGVNATGMPFNSVAAAERAPDGRTNPMVNSGAIATVSLVPGPDVAARWAYLRAGLSRFAGRPLSLADDIYADASSTNHRNRALAALLSGLGALAGDAADATDLYTRQSCLAVTAVDLAVMGATLADGGVNPVTGERVVGADVARATLAVMAIAGLYETSGDWLMDVGMPGKSGIGGGIVTVSPGKGALGTFAPLLDQAGNSVKGQLVAGHLTRSLGLDLFASQPVAPGAAATD